MHRERFFPNVNEISFSFSPLQTTIGWRAHDRDVMLMAFPSSFKEENIYTARIYIYNYRNIPLFLVTKLHKNARASVDGEVATIMACALD